MTPLLAQSNTFGNLLMLAGVVLLMTVLLYNIRKRTKREGDRPDPREKLDRQKQTRGMQNDLREMMVELENVTRQFSSQLDAKSRKLEQLIEQADQRIEALQRASRGQAVDVPTDPPQRASAVDLAAGGSAPGGEASRAADEASMMQAAEPTPVAKKVYQLADAGCDAGQIAKELDEHIGKIELILALRQEESAEDGAG